MLDFLTARFISRGQRSLGGAGNPAGPVLLWNQDAQSISIGEAGIFFAGSVDEQDYSPGKVKGVSAVWCAINFLASTIASLPLHVFARGSDGGRSRVEHDLDRVINRFWSDELTSYAGREWAMQSVLTDGAAYIRINRNRAGRVTGLLPLPFDAISVSRVDGRRVYRYQETAADDRRSFTMSAQDVIEVAYGYGADMITPLSPLRECWRTLAVSCELDEYLATLFKNRGVPAMALETNVTHPEKGKELREKFADSILRLVRRGDKAVVLPYEYHLKPIGYDPTQTQINELRLYQVQEVARVFNLTPLFLQDLSRGTYSNTEQQDLNTVKHTITRWVRKWEQELSLKLLGRDVDDRTIQFDLDGLLRGDSKQRSESLAQQIQNAMMTPNEARGLLNRARLDGGDSLFLQKQMRPIDEPFVDEVIPDDQGDDDGQDDQGDDDASN